KCAVIVDVEATTAVRQAEVTAQRRMIDRTQEHFGLWPGRLAGDAGYGSAENLAWLVHERGIEPHIPVFDKSQRTDGTLSRHDFARDRARDIAATEAYVTSRRERKKVEMLFAHLKRILKLDRLRLRGPNGARDEFHLAATAQNLRKLAMLIPVPAPTSTI